MGVYLVCSSIQNAGFFSQAEVFCKTRDKTFAADLYSSYIKQKLSEFSLSSSSEHLAALIVEPGKKVSLFEFLGIFFALQPLVCNFVYYHFILTSDKISVLFHAIYWFNLINPFLCSNTRCRWNAHDRSSFPASTCQ
jgi:hypothetical protein